MYKATAQAAATDIQIKPKMLTGENKEQSSPAGTASATAARMACFQSTVLASRTGSLHRSGGGCPGVPSAAYSNCGKPQAGQ
jgi:hypothetical protein